MHSLTFSFSPLPTPPTKTQDEERALLFWKVFKILDARAIVSGGGVGKEASGWDRTSAVFRARVAKRCEGGGGSGGNEGGRGSAPAALEECLPRVSFQLTGPHVTVEEAMGKRPLAAVVPVVDEGTAVLATCAGDGLKEELVVELVKCMSGSGGVRKVE